MKLGSQAPDGKPWREDALHLLGASTVAWYSDGPTVEPKVDLAKYADAVTQADTARAAHAAVLMRRERDARLAACDWTQLADVSLTKDQVAAWKAYRQALRDLPAVTGEGAAPSWPTSPEA